MNRRRPWIGRVVACIFLTFALVATTQSAAAAEEFAASVEVAETIDGVEVADDDADVVPDNSVAAVELPDNFNSDATINVDGELLELAPPIETNGDVMQVNDTTVISSDDSSVDYAVQATKTNRLTSKVYVS